MSTAETGPYKLDEAMIKLICGHVSKGSSELDACLLSGISRAIFYRWKRAGSDEEDSDTPSIYKQFEEALRIAEAHFKKEHLGRISAASNSDKRKQWQASAWLLERKFPQEFALRQQVALTDKLDAFVRAFDEIK
jgi:hypothetical protein